MMLFTCPGFLTAEQALQILIIFSQEMDAQLLFHILSKGLALSFVWQLEKQIIWK